MGDSRRVPRAVRAKPVSVTRILITTVFLCAVTDFGPVRANANPDGVYVSGPIGNTPCPVADLPSSLTDPATLGEWVVNDELCYETFPRRTQSRSGKYVLWKENFFGRRPHLTQTTEDPDFTPDYEIRATGGVVSMANAHAACCDGWWMRGFHLEDTYGRKERCSTVTREYDTTTWLIKKVTDDVSGRDGTHGANTWIAEFYDDGSIQSFKNTSATEGGYWTWSEGVVFLDNREASALPVAVQLDQGSLGFEYPYERTFPAPRIVTPASKCNANIAVGSNAYRICVENLLNDNTAGTIKIAIVPLYFTTSSVSDVDTDLIEKHYAGGADNTLFAQWWSESSFDRQNDIELVVLDPVAVNLPEWVTDADASASYNGRVTSTACKTEISQYSGSGVGFDSEANRAENSACSEATNCVRPAWKWDYTNCDGNCKVYGWEDFAPSDGYACVDLTGKTKPGDSSSDSITMTGVQIRSNPNSASAFYGLTDDEPGYKCVDDTNFMSTNANHLTGRIGALELDPDTYHRVVWSAWRTRCSGYGGSGHYRLQVSDSETWSEFGSSMTVGTTTFASMNGGISQNSVTPSRLNGDFVPADYVNPKGAASTFIHELVHSFGVKNHARVCTNDVATHLGSTEYTFWVAPCTVTEYGSWMSVMGKFSGTSGTHVHAGTMYDMHLLHKQDVHVVTSSGSYTIKPLNSLTTNAASDKRAAVVQFTDQHIDSDTTDWTKVVPPIWVEYRNGVGVDQSLEWDEYVGNTNGIILNWGHQYGDFLLDLDYGTPSNENSLADVSLKAGASFIVNQFSGGAVFGTVKFSNINVASDKSSVTFTVTYAATATGGGGYRRFLQRIRALSRHEVRDVPDVHCVVHRSQRRIRVVLCEFSTLWGCRRCYNCGGRSDGGVWYYYLAIF